MKKKKQIKDNNRLKNAIIIPAILLGLWIVLSLLFVKTVSYSLLAYEDYFRSLSMHSLDRIHVGEKITGVFSAKEDNLAILLIKFYDAKSKNPSPNHILSFKIKYKDAKNWFYEHGYNIGQIEGSLFYPFGFPKIIDSKNKTYEFEISTNTSDNDNYVTLKSNASVISGYYFSKSELLHNKTLLFNFIFKKLVFSFASINFILRSFVFLLPLLLFLSWKIINSRIALERQLIAVLTFVLLIIDIFLIREIILGLFISICIAWLVSIKVLKIGSTVSVTMGLIFVLLGFFTLIIYPDLNLVKLNQWSYFFLVVAAIQFLIEENFNLTKFSSPRSFVKKIIGK